MKEHIDEEGAIVSSVLGKDLKNILEEVQTTVRKYKLKKLKSNITEMIETINVEIDHLFYTDTADEVSYQIVKDHKLIAVQLEAVRKNMFTLKGKIGFNDYNRFKELCEELDAHIVTCALKNA